KCGPDRQSEVVVWAWLLFWSAGHGDRYQSHVVEARKCREIHWRIYRSVYVAGLRSAFENRDRSVGVCQPDRSWRDRPRGAGIRHRPRPQYNADTRAQSALELAVALHAGASRPARPHPASPETNALQPRPP